MHQLSLQTSAADRSTGMLRIRRIGPLLALLFVASMPCTEAFGQLQGKVVRVGLTGGSAGGHVIRNGCWTPVDVQLTNTGGNTFSGSLLLGQADRDGDVAVATAAFVLQAGQTRAVRVYCMPFGGSSDQQIRVTVRDDRGTEIPVSDEKGTPQRELASNPLTSLHEGELLVLEVNPTGGGRLAALQGLMKPGPSLEYADRRAIKMLPVQSAAIPDRWYGLEFADAMVWDDADVTGMEPEQLHAVAQWVFSGGRLLISGGRNWQALAASALADLLPVQINGVQQEKHTIALTKLYGNELPDPLRLAPGAMVTRCTLEPRGSIVAGIWPYPADAGGTATAFRRAYGRGVVTFIGTPLRELFSKFEEEKSALADVEQTDDEEDVPGNRQVPAAGAFAIQGMLRGLIPVAQPARASGVNLDPRDLFGPVSEQIGFARSSGSFVLFSILFSAAYAIVATIGSWHYLKRRGWTHHAWSAFVVLAIVATGLGMTAVWGLRGFSRLVNDVQVVDAWANNGVAQSQCIFGLRTPRHTDVRVTLPTAGLADDPQDDLGPICTLPILGLSGDEPRRYVAPATYREDKDGRRLNDVSVRATLKEFAGRWQGTLSGQLDANLVSEAMRDRPGGTVHEFVAPSFIRNNLTTDLRGCILLETTQDSAGMPSDVRVYPVGDLKVGSEFRAFGDWFRTKKKVPLAQQVDEAVDPEGRFLSTGQLPNLGAENGGIRKWITDYSGLVAAAADGTKTRSLGTAETALLLLSVFDLYSPDRFDEKSRMPLGRSFGRQLNTTHRLSTHSAILIGFSDDPGPANVHVDGQAIRATRSVTMYRFLIPVERRGL